MVKKIISRKRFLSAALGGIAGIRISSGSEKPVNNAFADLRNAGRTGIMVSPICFGAPRTSEESLIRYALDKGINFIDTGRAYTNGKNEELVGRAIEGRRKDVVVQSKIRLDPAELPSGGTGRKGAAEIKEALESKLEASLKAMKTDFIDILLYHDATEEKLLFHPEVMKFFSDHKSSGVIRAHGFSAHNDRLNLHERNNTEGFYNILMVPFNHKGSFIHSVTGRFEEWDQKRLIAALTTAGEKGIGVIAMKTCSGGKYSPSPGKEPDYAEAVKWVIQHPFISSAAIAMANFSQVDENISWLKQ